MEEGKKKKRFTFFSDFKAFLSRGNILDLAVAVIIGAAFGKIVASFVNDIIMPLISLVLGGVSFADLKWVIKEAKYDAAGILVESETALGYGAFIQSMIDFLIIAFCIFIFIRIVTGAQRRVTEMQLSLKKGEKGDELEADVSAEVAEEVKQPTQEELLAEIRDLLKAQSVAVEIPQEKQV